MDNEIITLIYNECVDILLLMAKVTGLTYKEVNVLIFCVLQPLSFIISVYIILKQHFKLKKQRV